MRSAQAQSFQLSSVTNKVTRLCPSAAHMPIPQSHRHGESYKSYVLSFNQEKSPKFVFSLLPRPGRGRGAECVIANRSFISFGCFSVTTLRVPFSQLISRTSWKYSSYTESASALERDDGRAIKVYLFSKHPGELFTHLIQTQIRGLKSKRKIWSLCQNPTFFYLEVLNLKTSEKNKQKANEQTTEMSHLLPTLQ